MLPSPESADRLAHALRHIADIEREEGHLQAALNNYLEAAAFYVREENSSSMDCANCARGLALLYEEINHSAEALDLWNQARIIYAAHGVHEGVDECDDHISKLA